MVQPLLLVFGMIAIATLIFALTRNLCRDPEVVQAEAERERQRSLAEAVVRNLNTHELVAIASGRVSAGLAASRMGARSRGAANGEQRAGVSEETRLSFVKISARKGGYAPSHADTDASGPTVRAGNVATGNISAVSSPDLESGHPALDIARPKSACGGAAEQSCSELVPGSAVSCDALPSRQGSKSVAAPCGVSPSEALASRGRGKATGAAESVEETAPGAYSDNSCSVCLEEYEEGKQLLQLTCGHIFHRSCIDLWLMSHRACPCCRADLDKLAKVVEVFPSRSRRSLQKALASAEGNIMVAVDFLLSERDRRSEANDGTGAGSGVGGTSGAALLLQASDRPMGTSRSNEGESICGLGSPSRPRDGAAFGGRSSSGDYNRTSGGPSNDSHRDSDAVGVRPESRPSSAARLFGRARPRDAEAASGATSSHASQLPLETPTGEIVGGKNRSAEGVRRTAGAVSGEMGTPLSQQVSIAIARVLQQRSPTESSSDAAESHERLGDTTSSPRPPGETRGEHLVSMGARTEGFGLPLPSAAPDVAPEVRRPDPPAVATGVPEAARMMPGWTHDGSSVTPNHATDAASAAARHALVVSSSGGSGSGGVGSSVIAPAEAFSVLGQSTTFPAVGSRESPV